MLIRTDYCCLLLDNSVARKKWTSKLLRNRLRLLNVSLADLQIDSDSSRSNLDNRSSGLEDNVRLGCRNDRLIWQVHGMLDKIGLRLTSVCKNTIGRENIRYDSFCTARSIKLTNLNCMRTTWPVWVLDDVGCLLRSNVSWCSNLPLLEGSRNRSNCLNDLLRYNR